MSLHLDSPVQLLSSVWQANPSFGVRTFQPMPVEAHSRPPQSASVVQVAWMHFPTGSPHKQISPVPQSSSRMQPVTQAATLTGGGHMNIPVDIPGISAVPQ
jgi:hypothetical protein